MKENKDKFIVCEYGTKAIIKVKMRQRTQMTHVTFKLKKKNKQTKSLSLVTILWQELDQLFSPEDLEDSMKNYTGVWKKRGSERSNT